MLHDGLVDLGYPKAEQDPDCLQEPGQTICILANNAYKRCWYDSLGQCGIDHNRCEPRGAHSFEYPQADLLSTGRSTSEDVKHQQVDLFLADEIERGTEVVYHINLQRATVEESPLQELRYLPPDIRLVLHQNHPPRRGKGRCSRLWT
jgi:hypothetical protein